MPSNDVLIIALLGVLFCSVVVFVSLSCVVFGYIMGCRISAKKSRSLLQAPPSFNIQETEPQLEDNSPYRDEIERLKKSMEARGVQ